MNWVLETIIDFAICILSKEKERNQKHKKKHFKEVVLEEKKHITRLAAITTMFVMNVA